METERISELLASATLLDCTLRDGGYCNNWAFSKETSEALFLSLQKVGIQNVEVGFRFSKNSSLFGPMAFSSDSYIASLRNRENLKLWVMINASDLVNIDISAYVNSLFTEAFESPIYGVRIATTLKHLREVKGIVPLLKSRGYLVAVNLMQAASLSSDELKEFGTFGIDTQPEILYLADSNGAMTPALVSESISTLRRHWPGSIGFHGHDNLGFALLNSVHAIESGANFIDGTVLGMGRGAGNLKTEEVMTYVKRTSDPSNLGELYNLSNNYFQKLKEDYGWGYNPIFVLSGIQNIHPDFAIETIETHGESSAEGIQVLSRISNLKDLKYSKNVLEDTLKLNSELMSIAVDLFSERHVGLNNAILLGPAIPTSQQQPILDFAARQKLPIFAINDVQRQWDQHISGRFFVNPIKLETKLEFMRTTCSLIIAPFNRAPIPVAEILKYRKESKTQSVLYEVRDSTEETTNAWTNLFCVLEKPITFTYALAYLATSGVSQLYLAGFEGYSDFEDPRFISAQNAIDQFRQPDNSEVYTLTPSRYRIGEVSPHGFLSTPSPKREP